MSMFKGHIVGGLAAYGIMVLLLSLHSMPLAHQVPWFAATLAGALFPDIDIRSKGQRLFLKLLLLLLILCLFLQAFIPVVFILVFSLLAIVVPHRSLFHELWFILLVSSLVALFLMIFMPSHTETIFMSTLFFLAGVLSHLLLDKGVKGTFLR